MKQILINVSLLQDMEKILIAVSSRVLLQDMGQILFAVYPPAVYGIDINSCFLSCRIWNRY
jgi:hypothetical protein